MLVMSQTLTGQLVLPTAQFVPLGLGLAALLILLVITKLVHLVTNQLNLELQLQQNNA